MISPPCTKVLLSALLHRGDGPLMQFLQFHHPTESRSMETDTQSPLRFFVEIPVDTNTAPVDAGVNYDDVVRSENNILQWMAYLPEDCIRTMIAMGWDVTT
jgi:hypothetical protein